MRHAAFNLSGRAFDGDASSGEVYGAAAAPLVAHALSGGHAALFMYGQTGSGKTHTMEAMHSLVAEQIFAPPAHGFHRVEVMVVEVLGRRCVDLCGATRTECTLLQQPGGVSGSLDCVARRAPPSHRRPSCTRCCAARSRARDGDGRQRDVVALAALVQISLVRGRRRADYTRSCRRAVTMARGARGGRVGAQWKAGESAPRRRAAVGRLTLPSRAPSGPTRRRTA